MITVINKRRVIYAILLLIAALAFAFVFLKGQTLIPCILLYLVWAPILVESLFPLKTFRWFNSRPISTLTSSDMTTYGIMLWLSLMNFTVIIFCHTSMLKPVILKITIVETIVFILLTLAFEKKSEK